jgi:hypothetical protein
MKRFKGHHVDPKDEIIRVRKSEDDRAWESYQDMCSRLRIPPLNENEFHLMAAYVHVDKEWR